MLYVLIIIAIITTIVYYTKYIFITHYICILHIILYNIIFNYYIFCHLYAYINHKISKNTRKCTVFIAGIHIDEICKHKKKRKKRILY